MRTGVQQAVLIGLAPVKGTTGDLTLTGYLAERPEPLRAVAEKIQVK